MKAIELLKEILEIKWRGEPFSSEWGYYFTIDADDRDKILGNIDQTIALLQQKPEAGEFTKEVDEYLARMANRPKGWLAANFSEYVLTTTKYLVKVCTFLDTANNENNELRHELACANETCGGLEEKRQELEIENKRLKKLLSEAQYWVSNQGYNLGLGIEIEQTLKEK